MPLRPMTYVIVAHRRKSVRDWIFKTKPDPDFLEQKSRVRELPTTLLGSLGRCLEQSVEVFSVGVFVEE
jgi:hypothetical protein